MSIFTRRHYIWLSNWARGNKIPSASYDLADALEAESPLGFDKAKFLHDTICGVHHEDADSPFCPFNPKRLNPSS